MPILFWFLKLQSELLYNVVYKKTETSLTFCNNLVFVEKGWLL